MGLLSTLLCLVLQAPSPPGTQAPQQPTPPTVRPGPPPTELHEVVRVVDGDTVHIRRGDRVVKLRLLSVDTEEKLTGRSDVSPTKPETLYGEECALWAQGFFATLGGEDGPPRVRLGFPGGREEYDVYGRLLCHVVLPDGTDFNLLLVRTGRSPYFNKYGNSLVDHGAFVAAQAAARREQLGIWNPKTNTPADPQAPAAKRPYDRLLPWWEARAAAVDAFRERQAQDAQRHVAADDPEALERAVAWCAGAPQREVEIFGSIDRFFDEDDGSRTVLFRSGSRDRAFRASIPAASRQAFRTLDLPGRTEEFRQNYLTVRGRLVRGPRGPLLVCEAPSAWTVAGPEPRVPADADGDPAGD